MRALIEDYSSNGESEECLNSEGLEFYVNVSEFSIFVLFFSAFSETPLFFTLFSLFLTVLARRFNRKGMLQKQY